MKFTTAIISLLFVACNNSSTTKPTGKDSPVVISDSWTENVPLPESAAVPANRLIVPGKSIGLCAIDGKIEFIDSILGPAVSGDASMGGRYSEVWDAKPIINGKDTVKYELEINYITTGFGDDTPGPKSQVAVKIYTTSPYFMTAQHIGVGSTLNAIQKNFSGLKKTDPVTDMKTNMSMDIYDDDSGIEFEVENGKCVGITVDSWKN
jgi:hypothetical protein